MQSLLPLYSGPPSVYLVPVGMASVLDPVGMVSVSVLKPGWDGVSVSLGTSCDGVSVSFETLLGWCQCQFGDQL